MNQNKARTIWVVEGSNKRRVDLSASDWLGSGAVGEVYRLSGQGYHRACVKIYLKTDSSTRDKLVAMIQSPPPNVRSKSNHVQFAWPTHLVENDRHQCVGFVMPEVDFKSTRSLVTYIEPRESQKFLTPEQRSLLRRVRIARNISALMADLHANGHAFIDLKDENIRIYPDVDLPAFIDTDGFRIQAINGRVFHGEYVTPLYNSPESVIGQRKELGEHHDRFILAILLFRLLNFGIHPFQGQPTAKHNGNFDIDTHIERQFYPYTTARPSDQLAPHPASIHEYWDIKTLALFEQTFLAKDPKNRVSAKEWAKHFRTLEESTSFKKCSNYPTDLEHAHFATSACHVCAALNRPTQSQPKQQPPLPPINLGTVTAPTSPPPVSSLTGSPLPPSKQKSYIGVLLKIVLHIAFWIMIFFIVIEFTKN